MESDNLRTASLYINNQLLSRGLLRNGQTIDFACPDKGEGGMEATMGKVMSIVNDLILRRDRDATQRETLSQTIRTLRADSLRQTTDFERLNNKYAEAQRKVGLAEAAERAFKQQIRGAEHAARGLKEEMGRMRILVNQTRNQCANEVRKRERAIESMKKHVGEGGRARGSGKAVGVVTINVTAGVGEEVAKAGASVGTDDANYDLRMETNEFLTELARGLSEENENIGGLLRRTVDSLRSLSGCEKDHEGNMVVQMDAGYESLAAEMDFVIEHLRTLLTNPSFVPLEEVEVREEEIIRLREGWERMESRWRDAVQMMEGWSKRMTRSGQTVNLEELKMGLKLSPLKRKEEENAQEFQLSTLMEEGEGDTQADIDAMDDSGLPTPEEPDFDEDCEDSESSLFDEEPEDEISKEAFEEEQQDMTIETASSLSPGPAPQLSPLRETAGNRRLPSPEKEGFTTIVEENTFDLLQMQSSPPRKAKSTPQSQRKNQSQNSQLSATPSDEVSLLKTSNVSQRSPRKVSNTAPKSHSTSVPKLQQTPSSRLPRPREGLPQQSPLTMASIAAKLAATEREADAARVRAKIKAAKLNRSSTEKMAPPPAPSPKRNEAAPLNETASSEVSSRKRKATALGRAQGGRANRRRSTLSPWELESLIMGGVGTSPSKD
ncbi:hypothetical protein LHYA1_G000883 [Lachnellula hyalina]|uniref:NIMA interactive protein n=1 Tax=Lachnellula hyalina TaxID=1316788 RepID=A0A8H8R7C2_9HELO|nr:uncharacterized protein LHYA1_G000883 [Lachnellula hyalina]TVY29694.1 hypothetical protein LHYA1_G000883 [Lachnellula hyalina]